MKRLSKSERFEKQIARIYQLLKSNNEEVTWNDKAYDPDNPKQGRQIDISIKNSGTITHIECRFHKAKQNVKWIEELIGRRSSLNIDYIIGVSSNGFTEGAKLKAKRFGIEIRDLISVSKEEVLAWGKVCSFESKYLLFKDAVFVILLDPNDTNKLHIDTDEIYKIIEQNGILQDVLNLNSFVNSKGQTQYTMVEGKTYKIEWNTVIVKDIRIKGKKIHGIDSQASIRLSSIEHLISKVHLFGFPEENIRDREVKIQEFDYEGWELIETPNRSKFTIDFSMLKHPENSYFLGGDAKGFDPNKKYDIALLLPQKISYCDLLNGVRFGYRYGFSDITG